jgi:arylsulfatase A
MVKVIQRLVSILCACLAGCMQAQPATPNIIIIYADDQGYGDLACLNPDAKFQTPNLDRIADEGIVFTNAHSPDSVCTPSRYGLLTGRYCWRTGLKRGVMGAEGKCLISPGRVTIASMLKGLGYRTGMVGKWHLGMDFPGDSFMDRDWRQPVLDMPLDRGFDYFYGVPASLNYGILAWFEGRHALVPPILFTAKKPNLRHMDYRIMPPYEKTPEATRLRMGKIGMEVAPDFIDNQCLTRFTEKAIDWMKGVTGDTSQDRPFFLYLPLTSPHYPVCPLPAFWGRGEAGGYGEFMVETDHHVGSILKFLDQSGLAEDTLLVYTSDNGPERSWRQRSETFGHRSNGPFREGKRSVYEGGHRVPFLVRWPGGISHPGRQWNRLIGQTDLIATLAELVDIQVPGDAAEDSQSFLAVMRNPGAQQQRLPLIHHAANGRYAITDGEWKLILPHRHQGFELYHLASDPGEAHNRVASHASLKALLLEKITRMISTGRSTPGPPSANDTGYWEDLAWMEPKEYQDLSAAKP